MSIEEAVAIIHPDTSEEALREYMYFHSKKETIDVINEACLIVCNVVKEHMGNQNGERKQQSN